MGAWRAAAAILASSASVKARRADDVDDARIGGEPRKLDRGAWACEIENSFRFGDDLERIGADRDADRADTGDRADVGADQAANGPLDGAGDGAALCLVHRTNELLAHAAGNAHHGDLHQATSTSKRMKCAGI